LNIFKGEKLWWVGSFGAIIGMAVAVFVLPGGDDLYRYYQPFALGCLKCGFVPYFAQWFLWPLAFLKYPLTWPIWTIFCMIGFLVLFRYTKVNPLFFLISFPMLRQIWLGQIDILVCAGLVILLLSRNPFLRGLGITLALAKPQLTALPIFFMLLSDRRQDLWKVLAIPIITFITSLFVYGLSWPYAWVQNALYSLPAHVWRLASAISWRYGLILLPLPFLFKDRHKRLQVSLLVSAIATPFFGVYSYIVFLIFESKWWAIALSFIWIIAYPFFQANSMYFAFILPLSLLFDITLRELRTLRQLSKNKEQASYA
jgi:hypothetical protein